ncbi:MAG: YqaE/Pmp3 family membrane protein [Puniceicoccales bacterium]
MSLVDILLCLFLPPVAVAVRKGIGMDFLINLILSLLLLWIGGVIHAFWVVGRK